MRGCSISILTLSSVFFFLGYNIVKIVIDGFELFGFPKGEIPIFDISM